MSNFELRGYMNKNSCSLLLANYGQRRSFKCIESLWRLLSNDGFASFARPFGSKMSLKDDWFKMSDW